MFCTPLFPYSPPPFPYIQILPPISSIYLHLTQKVYQKEQDIATRNEVTTKAYVHSQDLTQEMTFYMVNIYSFKTDVIVTNLATLFPYFQLRYHYASSCSCPLLLFWMSLLLLLIFFLRSNFNVLNIPSCSLSKHLDCFGLPSPLLAYNFNAITQTGD